MLVHHLLLLQVLVNTLNNGSNSKRMKVTINATETITAIKILDRKLPKNNIIYSSEIEMIPLKPCERRRSNQTMVSFGQQINAIIPESQQTAYRQHRQDSSSNYRSLMKILTNNSSRDIYYLLLRNFPNLSRNSWKCLNRAMDLTTRT